MSQPPDSKVVEMPWTWERYMRLAALGYYNRKVETELPIAALKAAGDAEGAALCAAHARRSSRRRNVFFQ